MKMPHLFVLRCCHQRGLTLIEIMVALLIGSFLLAGVIQIFIVNKQTYRAQENLSRLQEDGRFALDLLNRYLRLAGYTGAETNVNYIGKQCREKIYGSTPIFKSPYTPLLGTSNDQLNDSDSITVSFEGPRAPETMSDCLGNPINSPTTGAVTRASNRFFIDNFKDPTSGKMTPTLYCDPLHSNGTDSSSEPLLSGVENMQIRYGQVLDKNQLTYVPIISVTDISQVESIQIRLLMRSADEINSQPQSYRFDYNSDGVDEVINPGDTDHPGDRRSRRVFTTTIALRNLVGCAETNP